MSESGWIGKTLGDRYRLDALLGQGGMSSVYKATDPNLRRIVAIKLIHSHLTADPEFVRRFELEAAAVAQLHHPNIIQVYDFNRDGSTAYMVLEYVAGESLDRRLRRLAAEGRSLPPELAARITADIADAIDYAHGQGLIHRDIKPANIMLGERGQAVLMDFGVAKIIGATAQTATGMLVGTAFYIAPEMVRGEPPSPRSDIYALGASLFEMLAGRPPFIGDSAMGVMLKHLNEPVPDLRKIAPATPPRLIEVVEKALSKDPHERYPSANAMATALRPIAAASPHEQPAAASLGAAHLPPSASTVIDVEPGAVPEVRGAATTPPGPVPAKSTTAALEGGAPTGPPPSASSVVGGPASARPARRGRAMLWLAGGGVVLLLLCLALGGLGLVLPFMFAAPTATPSATRPAPTATRSRPTATRPASTATQMVPNPTATAAVVFQDDFTNSASGWTINTSATTGSLEYGQGEYVMRVIKSSWIIPSTSASGDLNNIHVEVVAANTGDATDDYFGVICDYSDDNHYYYMGISPNATYGIAKIVGGARTVLTDVNNQAVHSDRIARDAASYRLGADCGSDGTLTLYVDGIQVATANDTTYTSGVIGLFVETSSQPSAEVRFRDLVVTALK